MKAKLFLFLLIVLSFSGCRKLINIDPNYVGEWRSSGYYDGRFYTLNITEDGGAEFERTFASGGRYSYGHEYWYGPLKSNGRRFQIAYTSPWFIVIENPVLTNDYFKPFFSDSIYLNNNWRIKFKYPKTIGYDGAEVVMYRHQF